MEVKMLVFNPTKTSFFITQARRDKNADKLQLVVGDKTIQESTSIELLGLVISKNLTWDLQFNKLITDLRQINSLLARLCAHVPRKDLVPIVHGLLLSKIRYGIAIFGNIRISEDDPINSHMAQLQIQLNKAVRTVCGIRLSDKVSILNLLGKVGILSVNQLAAECLLIEIWKTINYGLPAKRYLLLNDTTNEYETRSKGKSMLKVPPREIWFGYKGPKIWNLLPQSTRDETNYIKVKGSISVFVKTLPV